MTRDQALAEAERVLREAESAANMMLNDTRPHALCEIADGWRDLPYAIAEAHPERPVKITVNVNGETDAERFAQTLRAEIKRARDDGGTLA